MVARHFGILMDVSKHGLYPSTRMHNIGFALKDRTEECLRGYDLVFVLSHHFEQSMENGDDVSAVLIILSNNCQRIIFPPVFAARLMLLHSGDIPAAGSRLREFNPFHEIVNHYQNPYSHCISYQDIKNNSKQRLPTRSLLFLYATSNSYSVQDSQRRLNLSGVQHQARRNKTAKRA